MWQTQGVWTPKASSGCPRWLAPHLLLHAQQVSLLKSVCYVYACLVFPLLLFTNGTLLLDPATGP